MSSQKLVRAPEILAASDDESGPRVIDEAERHRGRAMLKQLTAHFPRREATEREREIIADYRQRAAAGAPHLSREQRDGLRRAK